jgi:recombination protein RecT
MENTQPAVVQKEITSQVLAKISAFEATGELKLPADYSAANALKGAMLILDELKDKNGVSVMQSCTKNSIAQALLKMVVEGLSPLKRQGYFIAYGDVLTWSRSYQGSIALAKRVADVKDVTAHVVYEGDVFEYGINLDTGKKVVYKHDQSLENINKDKIKAAYAIVRYNNGEKETEIMTMEQVRQAWNQGATKGQSPAHKNFTDEMAKKTVINRACKTPINSSTDAFLLGDEYEQEDNTIDIKHEIVTENASVPLEIEAPKRKAKEQRVAAPEPIPTAEPSALQPDQSFDLEF